MKKREAQALLDDTVNLLFRANRARVSTGDWVFLGIEARCQKIISECEAVING